MGVARRAGTRYSGVGLCTAALALLLTLCVPVAVLGDSESPPQDYTVTTANGDYVFVMLAPGSLNTRGIMVDRSVRDRYARSGLYRNGASSTPLWIVDWYAREVFVSSDGKHAASLGPQPLDNGYGDLAIAFYENGKPIKTYLVDDLVSNPASLPRSISHYQWLNRARFSDRMGKVLMSTVSGEYYVFDISSGGVIKSRLVYTVVLVLHGALNRLDVVVPGLLLAGVVVLGIIYKRRLD